MSACAPRHCYHQDGPNVVCCWCGDLHSNATATVGHGIHTPEAPEPSVYTQELVRALQDVLALLRVVRKSWKPETTSFTARDLDKIILRIRTALPDPE